MAQNHKPAGLQPVIPPLIEHGQRLSEARLRYLLYFVNAKHILLLVLLSIDILHL